MAVKRVGDRGTTRLMDCAVLDGAQRVLQRATTPASAGSARPTELRGQVHRHRPPGSRWAHGHGHAHRGGARLRPPSPEEAPPSCCVVGQVDQVSRDLHASEAVGQRRDGPPSQRCAPSANPSIRMNSHSGRVAVEPAGCGRCRGPCRAPPRGWWPVPGAATRRRWNAEVELGDRGAPSATWWDAAAPGNDAASQLFEGHHPARRDRP